MEPGYKLFSDNEIRTYAEGNCHLLSFLLACKTLKDSSIYVLRHKNEIVHSIVKYKGFYYDIYGKYPTQSSIIENWMGVFDISQKDLTINKMKDISELDLDRYTISDKENALRFVTENMEKIFNRPFITKEDTLHYNDIQGYVDMEESLRYLLANPMLRQLFFNPFMNV